jgi:hypothetical protein
MENVVVTVESEGLIVVGFQREARASSIVLSHS